MNRQQRMGRRVLMLGGVLLVMALLLGGLTGIKLGPSLHVYAQEGAQGGSFPWTGSGFPVQWEQETASLRLGPEWEIHAQVFNDDLVVKEGEVIADDVVVYNGDVRVEGGGMIQGNLFVYSGDITIKAGGMVQGDVASFGGEVDVAGQVGGNLQSLGGNIQVRSPATIQGDVSVLGGEIDRDPGATIGGNIVSGPNIPLPSLPQIPGPRATPDIQINPRIPEFQLKGPSFFHIILAFFGRLLRAALLTLMAVVLAGVLVSLRPQTVEHVTDTMLARPGPSFGIGLVAGLVALGVIALLFATLCLSPLGALLLLATLGVGLVGWAATGQWLGRQIGEVLKVAMPPLQATAVGVFLISGVTTFLWALTSCLGIIALIGFGATGLGATLLRWRDQRSGTGPTTPSLSTQP